MLNHKLLLSQDSRGKLSGSPIICSYQKLLNENDKKLNRSEVERIIFNEWTIIQLYKKEIILKQYYHFFVEKCQEFSTSEVAGRKKKPIPHIRKKNLDSHSMK